MDESPNHTLSYIDAAQAQKHVTYNKALRRLDAPESIAPLNRSSPMIPG